MNRFLIRAWLWARARLLRPFVRFRDRVQTAEIAYRLRKCGSGVCFRYPCGVYGAEQMEVGDNVFINRDAVIRAQGGLTIGDNVVIARNVTIYTYNHNFRGQALPFDQTSVYEPVTIGDNVWIGINVTIVPGVQVGEGAIIAAGAVVSRDVPPLAIVGSAPQKILGYRDQEHYNELKLRQKVWSGSLGTSRGVR